MLGEFAEIVHPQFYYYGKSENSVLILLPTLSLSGDLNSPGAPLSFYVFILECAAFRLKLHLV